MRKNVELAGLIAFFVAFMLVWFWPATANEAQAGQTWEERYLRETTLDDGTRCVVFRSLNGGGIDCDWGAK